MAVMPRESWTDERLDDFRGEVNRRFDETNRRMEAGFAELRQDLRQINERFDGLHQRIDTLQQMMIRAMFIFGITLLGALVAIVLRI